MAYKIESGVPMPESRGGVGGGAKYPFKDMKPGDSFFEPLNGRPVQKVQALLGGCGKAVLGPGAVATRSVEEGGVAGVRVWRK